MRQLANAGYPELLDQSVEDIDFESLFVGIGVWIAADRDNVAVGYARAGELSGLFWLHQLSVDPAHGRLGIGTALLVAVLDHAKWAFYNAVGLTTFSNVAFNAPFYEKVGFLRVNEHALSPILAAQLKKECPPKIELAHRVAMIRKL